MADPTPEQQTIAVLRLLAQRPGQWHTWDHDGSIMPSVDAAFPPGWPRKKIHARMKRLIARGLVDGCGCGCRGDFEITAEGCAFAGIEDGPHG